MENAINVSYSGISTFQQCPRKYKWSYIEGLSRATYEATPASLGSAIHAGIAFALNWYHSTGYDGSNENTAALFAALDDFFISWRDANSPDVGYNVSYEGDMLEDTTSKDKFEVMVNEAFVITLRTIEHLDVPKNWRTVELNGQPLIEYKNTIGLGEKSSITYQIDWVAHSLQNDMTFVVDWKSRKTFQPSEMEQALGGEDFNFQISLYAAALAREGVPTHGTITYQIAPHSPDWPAIIKNGRVSKANIRTDWPTYQRAIVVNNENPDDEYYAEMQEKLSKQVWWSPVTIYRSEVELKNRWGWAIGWASRMSEDTEYLPVENIMCRMCPFAKLCIGVDRELDVDSIKEMEYTVKQAKETGVTFDDGEV